MTWKGIHYRTNITHIFCLHAKTEENALNTLNCPKLNPKNQSYWRRLLCLSFSFFSIWQKKPSLLFFATQMKSWKRRIDVGRGGGVGLNDVVLLKIFFTSIL